MQLTPSVSNELLAENTALKEELLKLRGDYRAVLDHSIDSDQRLLEYTSDIFLPPPATISMSSQPTPVACTYVCSATQTEGVLDVHEKVSFRSQDLGVEENLSLSQELALAKGSICKLQLDLVKIKEENVFLENVHSCNVNNTDLSNKLCTSSFEKIENLRGKLAEQDNTIQSLVSKLDHAVSTHHGALSEVMSLQSTNMDKWLDDNVLQAYFSSFNESHQALSSKALFVGPCVAELLMFGSPYEISQLVHEFMNSDLIVLITCSAVLITI